MRPLIIVQREISQKMPAGTWSVPASCDLHEFSAAETAPRDALGQIDIEGRPACLSFVTIPVARLILREFPHLSASVERPSPFTPMGSMEDFLLWQNYRARFAPELLLNPHGHIVPAGDSAMLRMAGAAAGTEEVFVRPLSPWKPFAGFSCPAEELCFEISARQQTDHLRPGELILIAPQRPFDPVEWRFYAVEQELVAWAPYSWQEGIALPEAPPGEIAALARQLAGTLHDIDTLVLDLGMSEGHPVLIEPNAVSTSGWYPGLDVARMIDALLGLHVMD